MKHKTDGEKLRELVVSRAESLGYTSYAIARDSDGELTEDSVRNYITGKRRLNADALACVLRILRMKIVTED